MLEFYKYVLGELRGDVACYMLEDVLCREGLPYDMSVREFHKKGVSSGEDVTMVYERIRDLMNSRIFVGINEGKINAMVGGKVLEGFFEVMRGGKVGGEVESRLTEKRDREIFEEFVKKCRGG